MPRGGSARMQQPVSVSALSAFWGGPGGVLLLLCVVRKRRWRAVGRKPPVVVVHCAQEQFGGEGGRNLGSWSLANDDVADCEAVCGGPRPSCLLFGCDMWREGSGKGGRRERKETGGRWRWIRRCCHAAWRAFRAKNPCAPLRGPGVARGAQQRERRRGRTAWRDVGAFPAKIARARRPLGSPLPPPPSLCWRRWGRLTATR